MTKFKDNGKKIELTIEVDKEKLLYHIAHRSSMTEEQIKGLFDNDENFRNAYMKIVKKLTKSFIEDELDECTDICDFAEKSETKYQVLAAS